MFNIYINLNGAGHLVRLHHAGDVRAQGAEGGAEKFK